MTDDHRKRLDLLILARLATSGRHPPSVRKLDADLLDFVETRLSRREWSTECTRRLQAMRENGDIDPRRVPTPQGLDRLYEALGIDTLPNRWSKIWRALMPALALDLPGARWSEVAKADKLRARLIRQDLDLPLPETPTLTQAVDAQAWQALGLDETGRFTIGKLRRALLERTLETSLRAKSLDANKAGQWLATAAAGTTKREIEAIQRALVSRWLFEPELSEPAPGPPPSLKRWADRMQALAETLSSGRYGDERVFIAAVWDALQAGSSAFHIPLPAFKTRLVEANREGFLRLHRADLVGAMDRDLVRRSETQHLNAAFHFIEISSRKIS